MEDFEKKIIKVCKEKDVQTISYEIWIFFQFWQFADFF